MNLKNLVIKLAAETIAKERPETMFEQLFFDLRLKMKDMKHQEAEKIKEKLIADITTDLQKKGYKLKDADVKLGRFRGTEFITSAKIHIFLSDSKALARLESYLRSKYSPKFKFKGLIDNVAEFNVR